MPRVTIPTPTEIITLAKAIHDKHVALGANTPLGGEEVNALALKKSRLGKSYFARS